MLLSQRLGRLTFFFVIFLLNFLNSSINIGLIENHAS